MRFPHLLFWVTLIGAILVAPIAPWPASAEAPAGTYHLGLVPSTGKLPRLDRSSYRAVLSEALPPSADLSPDLPPIGDQGTQNSCVGWTVGYYYKTYQERQERGWAVHLPQHQYSPAWIYNQRQTTDCSRDVGMSFYDAFSIVRDKGAATVAAFPYDARSACTQPSEPVRQSALPARSEGFANVFAGRGSAELWLLKSLLAHGRPFALAVPVYRSFFSASQSDPLIRRPTPGEGFFGGHAVLVVGYDDGIGGFKIANSWGQGWGAGGFAYLAYDFVQYDAWEAWLMTDRVESVTTTEIELYPGWNLISLPLEPSSGDLVDLLQPVADQLQIACAPDPASAGRGWLVYAPDLAGYANTLTTFDIRRGIWLNSAAATMLRVSGRASPPGTVSLHSGWNLISYPRTTSQPVAQAFASIAGELLLVCGQATNGGGNSWCTYDPAAPSGSNALARLEPGRGYWVKVARECTWELGQVPPEEGIVRRGPGSVTQDTPPALPAAFAGELVGAAASAGTTVTAWVGERLLVQTTAQAHNDRLAFALYIPADDPMTPECDGGREGDEVHFRIGPSGTAGTAFWHAGQATRLDLHTPTPAVPLRAALWLPALSR